MHAQLRCVRDYRISVCQYGGATCYSTDHHCGLSPSICGLRLTHSNKWRYFGRKRFCNRSHLKPTTEVERLHGLKFTVLNSNNWLLFNRNLLKTRRPEHKTMPNFLLCNFWFTYLNNKRHIALFYLAMWMPHTLKCSVTILKFHYIPKCLIVDLQIRCVGTIIFSQYSYQI
jgi:hypothetical protein